MEGQVEEIWTNAAEMARARHVDGKRFRARLRRHLREHHTFGSWRVMVGSDKHRLMERELNDMERAEPST